MSLMGSLGLDDISSDPNDIPDGKYQGEVFKDEYVYVQSKDEVAHVLTYRVTEEGPHKGAQRPHWFTLGKGPVRDENGNIVGLTEVTMDETKKRWYKKAHVDLGVPEDQVSQVRPGQHVGKKITFGVKRNGQYVNINFVELRNEEQQTPTTGGISGLL